jgi:hypothetical protein
MYTTINFSYRLVFSEGTQDKFACQTATTEEDCLKHHMGPIDMLERCSYTRFACVIALQL